MGDTREVSLDERLQRLRKMLEDGRIHLPKNSPTIASLKNVKVQPDGKVIESTVDGHVRALILAIEASGEFNKADRLTVKETQEIYFGFLENIVGDIYLAMKKTKSNPHEAAAFFSSKKENLRHWASIREELGEKIEWFWKEAAGVVTSSLVNRDSINAVFGGDIFPSYLTNIACSVGLYVDTIALPDPVLRTTTIFRDLSIERQYEFLLKHALSALDYKDLALADVDPPIVVVVPEPVFLQPEAQEELFTATERDIIAHAGMLFGREFRSDEELTKYLKGIRDIHDLIGRLVSPDRLLFDVEWKGTLEEQIERYRSDSLGLFGKDLTASGPGFLVNTLLLGRMMQTNEAVLRSQAFRGTPLIDAPTSWKYFTWKYEYDALRGAGQGSQAKTAAVTYSLAVAGEGRFPLIKKVPKHALIELRKRGALSDLRKIIGNGIREIDGADEVAFRAVADGVIENIERAIAEHKKKLADYGTGRNKFFGYDVAPWIAVGGLSVAAAATGSIPLGIVAALAGTIGAPSARDVVAKGRAVLESRNEVKRSPVGICFDDVLGRER